MKVQKLFKGKDCRNRFGDLEQIPMINTLTEGLEAFNITNECSGVIVEILNINTDLYKFFELKAKEYSCIYYATFPRPIYIGTLQHSESVWLGIMITSTGKKILMDIKPQLPWIEIL